MARTTISSAERVKLRNEIRIKLKTDSIIPIRTKKLAQEVADYWRDVAWPESGPHPYETGRYRDSIKVNRVRARFGMPAYEVLSDDPHANFIEFGTGPDKPGSRSPWGPNTPTPEFAPAAKTALHFGGTPD